MDNISTETPVGGEGATSSQDNVNVDTQTAETPVAVSDSQEAEAGQAPTPWDNDPKFKGKSPEDIYQAYKEAEKLTGQLSQKAQIANLIEQKYGLTPEKLKAQIEQMEIQERQERYANNPLAPLVDEVAGLKAKIAQQEQEKAHNAVKAELDSFLKDNPSYEAHKDKIYKLALTPNIGFNPETGEEVPFETLAQDYFGAARAQGQQDAYKKIEQKQMTQVTTTSKGKANNKVGYEALKELPLSERLRTFEKLMQ